MFDINKLPEWKSALDDGFELRNIKIFGVYISIDIVDRNYIFYHNSEEKGKLEIIEKDFDVFCQKVSQAILNIQE